MTSASHSILDNPRFQKPAGLQTHRFYQSQTGHWITYGCLHHPNTKGHIVILPGLSEFIEKYHETIQDFYDQGYSVWVIDWHYQGRSGRFAANPHKRHSDGFDTDIADLRYLIHNYIPETKEIPLLLVAHSTGGNLALRYINHYPDSVSAALLTSPLLGIFDTRAVPNILLHALSWILSPWHTNYVPCGSNWRASERPGDGSSKFSSDPLRDQIHNAWCLKDSALQVGSPTFGWVHHALQAIAFLHKDNVVRNITTPCLFVSASHDTIVDIEATKKYADKLQNAEHLTINDCQHELFVEKDEARNKIFKQFDIFLKAHSIHC